jgi:hypothetical protein
MFPFAVIHAPLGSFLPCVVFLILPPFIIYLVNRSVMGEIGCFTAFMMSSTTIYLFAVICLVEDSYLHYCSLVGIFMLLIGLPIITFLADKWDDKQMAAEQIKICYQQIRMNPQNGLAAFRLAQHIYKRGEVDIAIAIASRSMPQMAPSLFREEHKMYHYWLSKANPNAPKEMACASCKRMVPCGALICPNCLGNLHLDRVQVFTLTHFVHTQKIIAVWVTVIICLIAIPMLGKTKPVIAVPSIIALIGIGIGAVVSAFSQRFDK